MRARVKIHSLLHTSARRGYLVECMTGDCKWTYTAAVKADAEEQARWHRDSHRRQGASR